LQQASGEVLPRYGDLRLPGLIGRSAEAEPSSRRWRAWFRPSQQRQKLLAYIITDQPETVSERILGQMHRGVTALSGTGMYTHQPHTILMCALTVTEVGQLKSLVSEVDASAFVIVSPARDILGRGFAPLVDEREPPSPRTRGEGTDSV
jgi:uncharacterized protein YaaQ